MTPFRHIPSIEQLLQRPVLARAADEHGRDVVANATRRAAADLRDALAGHSLHVTDETEAAAWIEARALGLARSRTAPSLRKVINATGVILHTNLGRAPLAAAAAARAAEIASSYSNLEYDLDAGTRGHRHVHAERLLTTLTTADAALVVNNAAAAALLTLAALAAGREVLVSRGELVEIGGGFRVPEILAQSGAILREVGTTNRTRPSDYAAAIGERTALILRVHPSNFHVSGFTERAGLAELAGLSRRFGVALVEDLGSGWLGVADRPVALADEPSVRASLEAGADLVIFSGDKLLGGPQAGVVVGRRDLVDRLRAHPLMRALRVDKMTYAALEATVALWAEEPTRGQIPLARMLETDSSQIEQRARSVMSALGMRPELECGVVDGVSTVGGGSAPGSELPSKLLAVSCRGLSAADLATRLRRLEPPVIARVQADRVVLDLRTVDPADDAALVAALSKLDIRTGS